MRPSKRLLSSFSKAVLAYLVALQALLGVWAAPFATASFDPSLTLCRTLADGEKKSGDTGTPSHCVAMCVSGVCSSDAPTLASATMEFSPADATSIVRMAAEDGPSSRTLPGSSLGARGPPSID